MSTSSISSAIPQPVKTSAPMFYVVSVKKMLVMSFFTLGLYFFYWDYRNWATCKRATGDSIIPILRALFGLFFLYALLKRVDRGFSSKGLSYKWSPALLTVGIFGTVVLSFAPLGIEPEMNSLDWLATASLQESTATLSRLYLVSFIVCGLQLWFMALIQKAINVHERDPNGEGNARLTLANWLWMLPGILFWALLALSWASLFFLVGHL